ncbi:hypothetical protein [Halocatena halophila]|uniref:hypothetical protein n=1 Tax=Halocatena halophila TaxID=2814576 RepID=UPI002ED39EC8
MKIQYTTIDSLVAAGIELLIVTSFVLACVLSLVIAIKGIRAYRESRDRGIAWLTAGIVLLGGGALGVSFSLASLGTIPHWIVITGANLVRLAGVVIIIVTIYEL